MPKVSRTFPAAFLTRLARIRACASPAALLPAALAALAAAALVLAALSAPARATTEQEAGGGTLTIGITQYPSSLHPIIDSMMAKSYVLGLARRPITAYDQAWELVCMVCTELPTLDNGLAERETTPEGGDGIAVTYTLHPDATWGDGTPVTTEDVVFTWEVGRHPRSGVAAAELFRRVLSIDVHDDKTFTIHVDRVTFQYNAMGGFDLLPAHLERAAFEADPATYRNTTTFDTDPTNPGLYFGPYKVVEAVTGSHLVFEPNATWYGEDPHFDRIVVRTIENTAALEANLRSGAIDMVAGEIGMNIDQGLAFAKRHGDDFNVIFKPGLTHEHMEANLDNPVLADLRVRRAILHGIDREAINQRLFDGRQPVSHHAVSPLDDVYTDDVRTYPYDPDKAAALLDEAGWTEIRGGVRHNAEGERLSLSLMTTAGNRTREQVQQVIQSMLARVGIEVRIENEPARVLFGETVQKRTFEDLVMFAWISAPEAVPLTTLHSEMIPSEANGWSGQNIAGYANAEMDALIERIEKELDEEKRTRLWHELQRLYAEDLPALPLYWRAQTHILPTWLEGVRPTGHLGPSTMWVEEWRRADG